MLPEPLAALQGVPYQAVGEVTQDEFSTIVKLLDLHMARERLMDIDGILQSLTTEPVFVIEYLPVNISNRWWWGRKVWQGREAVITFYQGLFETFRGFEVSILRYAVSPRGVVDLSQITGRVLPIGSGIPISVTVSAFLPFDPVARRLTGERVYLSENNALKDLRCV